MPELEGHHEWQADDVKTGTEAVLGAVGAFGRHRPEDQPDRFGPSGQVADDLAKISNRSGVMRFACEPIVSSHHIRPSGCSPLVSVAAICHSGDNDYIQRWAPTSPAEWSSVFNALASCQPLRGGLPRWAPRERCWIRQPASAGVG